MTADLGTSTTDVQAEEQARIRRKRLTVMAVLAGAVLLAILAQDKGLQTSLTIDRDAVARLGLTQSQIDATLNDLFGQRKVSTIYHPLNQYHVVMEAAPEYWQSPDTLRTVYVTSTAATSTAATGTAATGTAGSGAAKAATTGPATSSAAGTGTSGQRVPLSDFSHYEATSTPLAVNHQGLSAASTVSFNLPPGVSLSQATQAIKDGFARLGAPITVRGSFQGTAKAFQDALGNQPLLILSALVAVYLVLGILYESLVHPLTILSTLPSAGVGALLALLATGQDRKSTRLNSSH